MLYTTEPAPRVCTRCRYQEVSCECIHCLRDLCDDCAELGCCCRKPASVRKFFPYHVQEPKDGRNAVPILPIE